MINICRKAFFYEQLKLGKSSFFEVPINRRLISPFLRSGVCQKPQQRNIELTFYKQDVAGSKPAPGINQNIVSIALATMMIKIALMHRV